jgi:hypothetical protein
VNNDGASDCGDGAGLVGCKSVYIVQFLVVGPEKIDLCRRLMRRVVDHLLHDEI